MKFEFSEETVKRYEMWKRYCEEWRYSFNTGGYPIGCYSSIEECIEGIKKEHEMNDYSGCSDYNITKFKYWSPSFNDLVEEINQKAWSSGLSKNFKFLDLPEEESSCFASKVNEYMLLCLAKDNLLPTIFGNVVVAATYNVATGEYVELNETLTNSLTSL